MRAMLTKGYDGCASFDEGEDLRIVGAVLDQEGEIVTLVELYRSHREHGVSYNLAGLWHRVQFTDLRTANVIDVDACDHVVVEELPMDGCASYVHGPMTEEGCMAFMASKESDENDFAVCELKFVR